VGEWEGIPPGEEEWSGEGVLEIEGEVDVDWRGGREGK
jgi:hypothetical protein